MLLGWGFRKKRDSGNEKCIDVNQSFPHNSKTKRDIAQISAVLKPMKSDYSLLGDKILAKMGASLFFGA